MCIICTENAIRDIVGVLNPFCRGRLKVNSTIGYDNFMAKKAKKANLKPKYEVVTIKKF